MIDLGFWVAILSVFETICVRAAVRWFPGELYWISVVPAVTAILYVRWGAWGLLYAVYGGALTSFTIGFPVEGYAIYALGNVLSIGALFVIKLFGRVALKSDALKGLLYGLAVFLLMEAGKVLVSIVLGWKLRDAVGTFAPEIVTLLFTEVVIWIVRRLDGMFEYQPHYVARIQEELENERGEYQ